MAAKSTTPKKYRGISASNFALGKGRYPINTAGRARSALARVTANGTPAQQSTVRAAVHKKYPNMQIAALKKPSGK